MSGTSTPQVYRQTYRRLETRSNIAGPVLLNSGVAAEFC